MPAVVLALDDRDPAVAREAVRALIAIGVRSPEVEAALLQMLQVSEAGVRREAILALRDLMPDADTVAVKALAAALKDQDPFVREQVAAALQQLGPHAPRAGALIRRAAE